MLCFTTCFFFFFVLNNISRVISICVCVCALVCACTKAHPPNTSKLYFFTYALHLPLKICLLTLNTVTMGTFQSTSSKACCSPLLSSLLPDSTSQLLLVWNRVCPRAVSLQPKQARKACPGAKEVDCGSLEDVRQVFWRLAAIAIWHTNHCVIVA